MKQNDKWTTHNFLHESGLKILENDLDTIIEHLKPSTNITEKHIELLRHNFKIINKMRNEYIQNANYPDEYEKKSYYEKYEFIPNYGMKVTKVRQIKLPFIFSQHFYSPLSVANYINMENKIITLMCNSKWKLYRELGYSFKKQGLTFNAMGLFKIHSRNAVRLLEENNFKLNSSIVKELSYASHYLEDLCETHHASNKIGLGPFSVLLRAKFIQNYRFKLISNHSDFEAYAFKHKEKYRISSVDEFYMSSTLRKEEKIFWAKYDYYDNFLNYRYMRNTQSIECFEKVCCWNALYSNCFVVGVCDFYKHDNKRYEEKLKWALSYNSEEWDKNIEQTLKIAQVSVAVFLFTFLLYMSDKNLFDFK